MLLLGSARLRARRQSTPFECATARGSASAPGLLRAAAARRGGKSLHFGTISAHFGGWAGLVRYEHMFATLDGTVDQALERRREARRREVRAICEQQARLAQRVTEIVREADDEGDWQAAGCSSSAQWLAQISSSDYRTAARITRTSSALRSLPALDHALSTGALTLDQVAAAAEFATPESDAELARVAVGKPPSEIALAARTIVPPKVEDDQELYERRCAEHDLDARAARARLQRPPAARAGRRLRAGHLEHRQAPARRSTSRPARSSSGSSRPPTRSSPSPATAARRAAACRRSPTTLIVHLSDDAPPLLEGAGPTQPRDRRATRLRRTPPHHQAAAAATSCTHASDAAPPTPSSARCTSAQPHCQYPGCTAARELEAHHLIPVEHGGKTELDNLILLCPRHHKLLHDHHIHTSGNGEQPAFTDEAGRAITTNQPHAPPR